MNIDLPETIEQLQLAQRAIMGSRAPEEAITRRRAVADQARRVLNKVPQPHGDRGQRYLVGQLVGMIEMAEG